MCYPLPVENGKSRRRKLSGISLFFPARNEEASVGLLVDDALRVLPELAEKFEIICVDDGSTDKTAEIMKKLAANDHRIRIVSHTKGRGYGAALKTGFAESSLEWIFFTDGDRQFRLDDLPGMAARITSGRDAIVGFRIKRNDPIHRLINAKLYCAMIRLVLGVKVRDIDCAYKLLPSAMVKPLRLKSDGAFLSAELLARLQNAGVRIKEYGVRHYPREAGSSTGAKLSVILKAFREMFALWGELRNVRSVSDAEHPSAKEVVRKQSGAQRF